MIVVDRFPIVIYTSHAFLLLEKFVRCVASEKKIISKTVPPSSRVLCTIVRNPYTPLKVLTTREGSNLPSPPPVYGVHLAIYAPSILLKWLLRHVSKMICICWLLEKPLRTLDNISMPEFDRLFGMLCVPNDIFQVASLP